MPRITGLNVGLRKNVRLSSFTLIELLTVMAIIAILAALILYASVGVMTKARRSRAASEIQAMSTALESYKTDNGAYPVSAGLTGPPAPGAYTLDPTAATYLTASEALYQALSGQLYFTAAPVAGVKAYMNFTLNQVGNPTASGQTYVKDSWGYSYGYSTGDTLTPQTKYPNNGSGFFDLWSTGGTTKNTTTNPNVTNTWISNWQ